MWNSIVFPLINELKPKYIVEVGSEKGTNTMSMLEYCEGNNAVLTCIDPFPLFDVEGLKNKYGDKFDMVEDLSLNVLPHLKDYDLILLDGDHNWYTIYNELKCIENTFNQDSFPFIFFMMFHGHMLEETCIIIRIIFPQSIFILMQKRVCFQVNLNYWIRAV